MVLRKALTPQTHNPSLLAIKKAAQKSYPKISSDSKVFLDWDSYVDKLVKVYERL